MASSWAGSWSAGSSCPRVTAATEETVLLIVGCGLAVRLDDGDLGECGLDGRALGDGVEPTRHIGVVLPLHALGVVVARPWEGRDVGDRVFIAAEIFRLTEPLLQHV